MVGDYLLLVIVLLIFRIEVPCYFFYDLFIFFFLDIRQIDRLMVVIYYHISTSIIIYKFVIVNKLLFLLV